MARSGWPVPWCSEQPNFVNVGNFAMPSGMDPWQLMLPGFNFCKGCGRHWCPPEPLSGWCGHCKEQVEFFLVPPGSALKIVPPKTRPATAAELKEWNTAAKEWTPGATWLACRSSEAGSSAVPLVVPKVTPKEPTKVVALWNLKCKGLYTEDNLREALMEIDFEPSKVVQCVEGKNAFGLSFSRSYLAEALVVALDCHPEPEKIFEGFSMDGPRLRAAIWKGYGRLDKDADIPDYVHEILAEQQEWLEETELSLASRY